MRDKILEIINANPKHYTRIIKSNNELYNWIMNNTLLKNGEHSFVEHIRSSVYNETNVCENNGVKKFRDIKTGFVFCGRANSCKCCKESVSKNVIKSMASKSSEETKEINEKRKNTIIEKYGVDNIGKIEKAKENHKKFYEDKEMVNSVLEKMKSTNLEKYGVENPQQNKLIQEKTKQTNMERYGVENPQQNKLVQEKTKQTNLERYGVENVFQNEDIKEIIKTINIKNHGVKYPMQSQEIKNKSNKSVMKKYGVTHVSRRHIPEKSIIILEDKEKFIEFTKDKSVREIAKELGVEETIIYRSFQKYDAYEYYRKRGDSYLEAEMKEFLDENNIKYETNDRSILNGKELDFYIPEYNLAIEMNGIYYHSDKFFSDKNYHYNKWKSCNELGIRLVSIFEDDWNLQRDKIKNMLLSFFNKKIKGTPARKSYIKKIIGTHAREFLGQYHLQGYVSGTHFGAFDKSDNIIGVMTFGTTRNGRFELKRFVTDNYTHPGLFSKLFKHAQKELNFTEVVSFSDNTFFTGGVYKQNGFEFISILKPDYRYLYKKERIHKSNFKKERIKQKFPELSESIDNGMTEREAMDLLNIPRIWDCGKCEWVWKFN